MSETELTMVGGDKLVLTVVCLATLDRLATINRSRGKLIGPVHPEYAGKDILLVESSDLNDPCNPVVGKAPRRYGTICAALPLDALFVRNINIVVGVKLLFTHYIRVGPLC